MTDPDPSQQVANLRASLQQHHIAGLLSYDDYLRLMAELAALEALSL